MRILIISQYFKPEVGAGAERAFYLAKYLGGKGHEVKVIAGIPNYPVGKVYKGYKLKLSSREKTSDNIEVIRAFVYPTKYTSTIRRGLNYLSFLLSSILTGVFIKKTDVIIASSPPLTVGLAGLILSTIKNKPLIFEARDVWPGAVVALGKLRNKPLIKILRFIEKKIYQRSKFIVAPTEDTKNILLGGNKYLSGDKVIAVSNSVDLELFDSQKIDPSLADKHGLGGKFVVLYSGTIGLQQGMKTLIECVKRLKGSNTIKFLVVGEGAAKDLVFKEKEKFKLNNLLLLDPVENKQVPSYVDLCDVGLALLRKNKYQDAAFAVKVFDYFAGEKPAIVSGGEAMRRLIEGSNAGFWVKAEDSKELAEKIVEASKMPREPLQDMGKKGRKLVENKYNRRLQSQKWDELLKSAVKGKQK